MKKLLFLFSFLLVTIITNAQISGTSGVIKATSKTNLDAVTPTPAQGEAVLGMITDGSVTSALYLWDVPTSSWIAVKSPFNVKDSTQIALHWSNDTLRASIQQMGATTNQYLKWDGTTWTPSTITASEVTLVDAPNDWTSTNLEALAAEIKDTIDANKVFVTDQVNGLDITKTGQTITTAPNIPELTAVTVAPTDELMIYDADGIIHAKITASQLGVPYGTYNSDALAAAASVPIGGAYLLGSANVYGGVENTVRYRKY